MKEALRHLSTSSATLKVAGLGLVWIALILLAYDAAMSPRSLVRRVAAEYVASIDRDFTSMLVRRRGAFIAWSQGCAAISLLVLALWLGSKAAFGGVVAVMIVPPGVIRFLMRRRLSRLQMQVHTFALALSNSLKTTASIGEALTVTVTVTPAPLKQELEIALKEVRVGSTLHDALLSMSARAQSTALDAVVSSVLIGRQTGGDLPRILEGTAASLRELLRLEELTQTVTRDAKVALGGGALTTLSLPALMRFMLPAFTAPLFSTVKGQLFILQCAFAFLFSLYLGYRITRTDI